MIKLTNKEKYWLAGFIDGDGCIAIRLGYISHKRKKFKLYKTYSYIRPSVEIGNTDKNVIKEISKLLNSKYRTIKRKRGYKNFYIITLSIKSSIELLIIIKNSLKIKKPQTELCLHLYKTFSNHKRTIQGRFRKLDKRTIKKRFYLYKQCKLLNKRGKPIINKNQLLKKLRKEGLIK